MIIGCDDMTPLTTCKLMTFTFPNPLSPEARPIGVAQLKAVLVDPVLVVAVVSLDCGFAQRRTFLPWRRFDKLASFQSPERIPIGTKLGTPIRSC